MLEIHLQAECLEADGLPGDLVISRSTYDHLARFITERLGIKMPDSKVSMIQSRLRRRIRELGMQSVDEYCKHLFSVAGGETERTYFFDAVTTNKTDFFREPQHFQYLTAKVLPHLESSGYAGLGHRLTVWSAACSSGEEPYTLAMVLSEYGAAHRAFDFRILATDVSTRVLQTARDGIYTEQQIEPIPAALRRKYLLRGSGEQNALLRVSPSLRRTISFHRLNFMDEDYCVREMFDVIFCRNVLIYFDRPTQETVINKLCRNLNPGGYLFISHSESLSGLAVPLVALGSSCFQKRAEESRVGKAQ